MSDIHGVNGTPLPDYIAIEREVLQDNVILVDAKSGILMAFGGVVIFRCLDRVSEIMAGGLNSIGYLWAITLFLYVFGAIGFLVTVYFTWHVVKPRITKTNDLVFWEADVFLSSNDHFATAVDSTSPEELRKGLLQHLHILARICREKFKSFQRAVTSAELAIIVVLLAELARCYSILEGGK